MSRTDFLSALTDAGRASGMSSTVLILATLALATKKPQRNGDGDSDGARSTCSFRGDMLVQTNQGFVQIQDVTTKMSVWSRDADTGTMAYKPVVAQYYNPYEETVTISIRDMETGAVQSIVSNKIHPYFVQTKRQVPANSEGHVYKGPLENGHWIDASELQAGDRLLQGDTGWSEVVRVQIEEKPLKAYNLTVADFHTYFIAANDNANPIWVHNDCFDDLSDLIDTMDRTEFDRLSSKWGQGSYDGTVRLK